MLDWRNLVVFITAIAMHDGCSQSHIYSLRWWAGPRWWHTGGGVWVIKYKVTSVLWNTMHKNLHYNKIQLDRLWSQQSLMHLSGFGSSQQCLHTLYLCTYMLTHTYPHTDYTPAVAVSSTSWATSFVHFALLSSAGERPVAAEGSLPLGDWWIYHSEVKHSIFHTWPSHM